MESIPEEMIRKAISELDESMLYAIKLDLEMEIDDLESEITEREGWIEIIGSTLPESEKELLRNSGIR